ncbi:hypothetical protein C8R45DRAFT_943662 [Mycena sanguinolenta]|nr:hypothetical protein C8R45DRAFT_943662 [Mycena sanguinolenta]
MYALPLVFCCRCRGKCHILCVNVKGNAARITSPTHYSTDLETDFLAGQGIMKVEMKRRWPEEPRLQWERALLSAPGLFTPSTHKLSFNSITGLFEIGCPKRGCSHLLSQNSLQMTFKRSKRDSDYDPDYMPPDPKRRRPLSLPPSSPPPIHSDESDAEPSSTTPELQHFAEEPMDDIHFSDRLPALFPSPLPSTIASGSSQPQAVHTPHRRGQRAKSLEPTSSPMSILNITPINSKRKLGRPFHTPGTRRLKMTVQKLRSSDRSPDKREVDAAVAELERKAAETAAEKARTAALHLEEKERQAKFRAEMAAKEAAEKQAVLDAADTRRAQEVARCITASEVDGGFNFQSLDQFFDALWRKGGDPAVSAILTRYVQRHGAGHAAGMFQRSQMAKEEFISAELAEIFRREGRAIQALLTRDSTTTIMDLLKDFSMQQLTTEIEQSAPRLWETLRMLAEPDQSTRREANGESRRKKGLVFTTICALISVLRSQKANNFQLVIGLFLLGSGASKREMEVLAHAGLAVSYTTIITHVKQLSKEGLQKIRDVCKSCMVQMVWDNLNIAFKVSAQRLDAKSHFDSGTTSTVIPVFDPSTGQHAIYGTLPLSMKPPRERTLPVLDWCPQDVRPSPESAAQLSNSCFWQLKRMALEHIPGVSDELKKSLGDCPEVNQIPLHKSIQYPLPALKEDESTLEGTFTVYTRNLQTMGMDDEQLEAHGLMFDDGDLLTDSLKEKARLHWQLESARRNSSTPIAGMKASVRRWGLFHAQMAGCRLTINEHWGMPNSLWPGGLWWEHNKLLKRKPLMAGWGGKKATEWKPTHELIHISLPAHIVDGFRIYCGHDSLSEWAESTTVAEFDMVAKTVFDKLFSTTAVNGLRTRRERDFTLENAILYNRDALFYIEFTRAIKKGDIGRVLNVLAICSSKSTRIFGPKSFITRKAPTRAGSVQAAFQIPAYGEKHKTPPIDNEVGLIAQALQDEKIQTYVADRPANDHINPVRDLIKEGLAYAKGRKAFRRFTRDTRRPEKRGFDIVTDDSQKEKDEEEEEQEEQEEYDPTEDDLRVDDEEFLLEPSEILASATDMVDSALVDSDVEGE